MFLGGNTAQEFPIWSKKKIKPDISMGRLFLSIDYIFFSKYISRATCVRQKNSLRFHFSNISRKVFFMPYDVK